MKNGKKSLSRTHIALRCLLILVATSALPAVAAQPDGTGALAADSARNTAVNTDGTTAERIDAVRQTECISRNDQDIPAQENQESSYVLLTAHCKFTLFYRQSYSPYTFAAAGFQATWAQAMGEWPHYGGGMAGWGKRFGATLADTESRRFIQSFALSTMLHQDPRYFSSHKNGVLPRAWYAVTRVAIGRSDQGHATFNSPEFLGTLFASSLQNIYYPGGDRSFGQTMGRFGGALSSDAISDILREFTPDIKRLLRRHTPEKIKSFERKLPIPPEDKL